LDRSKTNTAITKELNITSVLENLQDCKSKVDTTCKSNAMYQITQTDKTLHPKRQKEPRKTTEETSACVRPERVNRWPNSLIAA
jgi:hypothetical protein